MTKFMDQTTPRMFNIISGTRLEKSVNFKHHCYKKTT